MARTLILYGTTEGRCGAVAGWLADALRDRGHSVELLYGGDVPADFPLDAFDAVVVAASVRDGRHQPYVVEFAREHRRGLGRVPTAFVSVSPAGGDAEDVAGESVEDAVDAFVAETGWTPDATVLVSGPPADAERGLLTRFFGHLSGGATGDTGTPATDDRDALSALVDEFALSIEPSAAAQRTDRRRPT